MGRITFVIGGARSGKSDYALGLAEAARREAVVFVATAEAGDREMARRIRRHQAQRPRSWTTIEEPRAVAAAIRRAPETASCIVVDCLTLLVSNLMLAGASDAAIEKEARAIIGALRALRARSVVVANEVGLGIVPDNALARRFRDTAGRVNRLIARSADTVVFMTAGIPLVVKNKRSDDARS